MVRQHATQLVALVSPGGAGKSNMASLLLRLYDPTKGQHLFDGKESTDIPLLVLRNQIALVPQDIFLFGGTIHENLFYGKPKATGNEIY